MSWFQIKNLQTVELTNIPVVQPSILLNEIVEQVTNGKRLVQLFGDLSDGELRLYSIISDDNLSRLYINSAVLTEKRFDSITPMVPAAHLFEREVYEELGVIPEGHPWLKPVRKGIAGIDVNELPYQFFRMSGEEVHEVGVGPIHAGIIEPGHFRFSCHGEKIYNLEIQLGFQHRGVEKLFVKNNNLVYQTKLAESVSGDTVIGHSGSFIRAIESLMQLNVSHRVKIIRTIALELERVAVHLGDLSALANDVAYLTGSSVFGALRTKIINTTMAICGNRFGRGLVSVGGVNFDISEKLKDKILDEVKRIEDEITLACEVMFSSASVLERFEQTGIVNKETAIAIGMVGPAARASGVSIDVRADHPFGGFEYFPVHKITLPSGDVFARAYIRFVEIQQSLRIIKEQLEGLTEGELKNESGKIKPNSFTISLTEGWRGEILYSLITDSKGQLKKVKIKDPSFNNWFALALAVRNEGISDFPLCNKSFNLSYCGFDL